MIIAAANNLVEPSRVSDRQRLVIPLGRPKKQRACRTEVGSVRLTRANVVLDDQRTFASP